MPQVTSNDCFINSEFPRLENGLISFSLADERLGILLSGLDQ